MSDKRTTNFKIWNGSAWVRTEGIINESLLCARPGCNHKPKKSNHTGEKKWCSTGCRTLHRRENIAKGLAPPFVAGSPLGLHRRPQWDKFLD